MARQYSFTPLPQPMVPLSSLIHSSSSTAARLNAFIAEPKGKASNRDALSFRVGMYVCISPDCTMQFYACVCISATLAQYNPILAYVCPSRFAQCSHNSVA